MTAMTADLYAAWRDRRDRAEADLKAAEEAPALFTPEWTIRALAEFQLADAWCKRWAEQTVRDVVPS